MKFFPSSKLVSALLISISISSSINAAGTFQFSSYIGSYQPLSESQGTYLDGGAGLSNINYVNVPVGFSFKFGTANYSNCGISTNGYLWFGNSIPSSVCFSPLSAIGIDGIVSPLGTSLEGANSSRIRYNTNGIAPFRSFIVEWKNFKFVGSPSSESFSFEIRLSEINGIISFSYSFPQQINNPFSAQVGVSGTTLSANEIRSVTGTSQDWLHSSGAEGSSGCLINGIIFCQPATGLVYLFNTSTGTTVNNPIVAFASPLEIMMDEDEIETTPSAKTSSENPVTQISCLPNPVENLCVIRWNSETLTIQKIQVIDLLGRIVLEIINSKGIPTNKTILNTSDLMTGNYFCVLQSDDGIIGTVSLLKK